MVLFTVSFASLTMLFNPWLGIFALLAFLLYPVLSIVWKTAQRINEYHRLEPANPDALPTEIAEALQPYIQDLESLQFQCVQYFHIYSGEVGHPPTWSLLFQAPSASHYVWLSALQPFQQLQRTVIVDTETFLDDGTVLITTTSKSYGVTQLCPHEIRQNCVGASALELWQTHQQKLSDLSSQTLHLSVEDFLAKIAEHLTQTVEYSVQQGYLRWVERGKTYRYTLRSALKLTLGAMSEVRTQKKKVPKQAPPIDEEIEAFLATRTPKTAPSKRKRIWLALGSLACFAAIYATRFEPASLLIFMGALILHEGGHLLAMLLCGYHAPAVFFIPYLGALATARKDHASMTEKFWILLAGPLPGLILGVGIAIATTINTDPFIPSTSGHSLWQEASLVLIGLNLFNLLPVYPLDGGQISDLLVFARNPYLGVIYKGVGVGLLLLLGLVSPLFFIFGLLIALSIPNSFRTAQWCAKLRRDLRQIPWQDDAATARLIFTQLQTAPQLSPVQKNMIAAGILDSRRADGAPWWSRMGLSAVYVVSLMAGIVGGLYALFPIPQLVLAVPESLWITARSLMGPSKADFRHELEQATQAIQQNPKDLEAYYRRGQIKLAMKDAEGAIADANTILSKDPDNHEAHYLRGRAYGLAGNEKKSIADQRRAEYLWAVSEIKAAQAVLAQNPEDIQAYIRRSTAKYYSGDRQGAFQDLETALEVNPESTQVLLARAGLHERQGNNQAALRDINRVIAIEPSNSGAYGYRSKIYDNMEQTKKSDADAAKEWELIQTSPSPPE